MGTQDFNDLFMRETAPSTRSYFKVVGVGHYGSTIVSIMSMHGLSGVDFAIVENSPIPMKCRMIDDNNIVDSNDPECEKKVREIIGRDTMMLFIVSGLEDIYCESIITSMCHQVHSNREDADNVVSVALVSAPSIGGIINVEVQNRLATIAQKATKVITFYRAEPCILRIELNEDEQQIIDVIQTICRLFLNHQYCFVDYNDVATVLQSGDKAVFGIGEGCNDKRVEKAAKDLMQNLETKGCMVESVTGFLLYIRFSPMHQPTVEELRSMLDILYRYIGKKSNVLYNATDDIKVEGDSLIMNAIAVF